MEKGYKEEEILASGLVNKTENGKFIDRYRRRLMFPIQDTRNRIIAFGGRVLDDSKPKYINSPENVVYSKGRHLFGLNVAKKGDLKKIIIVEGYMDAISLHQRGITNVVASLGTALTEAQGRLLRKSSEQVIIGYDADGAGQAATLRGLEILNNLGCDIRILQIEGAKDPDEFVIKYGPERFQKQVDKAISLVEFKIKMLKNNLNLDHPNDKIKFLKEIANILAKIDNEIEREVYIRNISLEYGISKEAIYAEIIKLNSQNAKSTKVLEKSKPRLEPKKEPVVNEQTDKREKLIIYLLINYPEKSYEKIKNNVEIEELSSERNQNIIKKLYEEIEKGNINNNNIIDWFEDEETINYLSWILAYDFEIGEVDKCIEDVVVTYQKEKLVKKRNDIIRKLEGKDISAEERENLENELNNTIIALAKIK